MPSLEINAKIERIGSHIFREFEKGHIDFGVCEASLNSLTEAVEYQEIFGITEPQELPEHIRSRQLRVASRNGSIRLKRIPVDRRQTGVTMQVLEREFGPVRMDRATLIVFGVIALEIACVIGIGIARALGWMG